MSEDVHGQQTETTEVITPPVVEKTTDKTEKTTPKEPNIRDPSDAIRELRRENEKLRKQMDERVMAEAEDRSNKKLEELRAATEETARKNAETLVEKRMAELAESNKARIAKVELKAQAMKAGVADFDDLYEILKKEHLKKVEFSEDGDVLNAAEIITELKVKKPHLFTPVTTSSTDVSPRGNAPVADVRNMSDADLTKLLTNMGVHLR